MCGRSDISVQGGGGVTLHHHPFLFAKVLDRLTDELRQESPWSKVFISTTLICSNSRDTVAASVKGRFTRWEGHLL